MTRPAPSLTLAVPRSQGFTAFSASALLHTLALGTMLAVTFGASGTLPEPAGPIWTSPCPHWISLHHRRQRLRPRLGCSASPE